MDRGRLASDPCRPSPSQPAETPCGTALRLLRHPHPRHDRAVATVFAVEHLAEVVEPVQVAERSRRSARSDRPHALRRARSSIAWSSSGSPSPVSAATDTTSGLVPLLPLARGGTMRGGRSAGGSRSILFQTSITLPGAVDVDVELGRAPRRRRCACASLSGCAMSRTWRIRSASATSSSVARNAATSVRRQVGDEADGVGEDDARAVRQFDPPQRRIERREQPVVGEDPGAGQRVEQRRLAGVGVADQRDHGLAGASCGSGAAAAGASTTVCEFLLDACRSARRSRAGRPRSASRRDRRGSRSRRAGARGGSSSGPGGSSGS